MSHFTKVATKINNLNALKQALEKLNLKYTEGNVEVRGWRGAKITADLAINMGKYDIGLVEQEDGNYIMVADWWGIETSAGKTETEIVEEVQKEYAYVRVIQACEEQGYQIAKEDISLAEDGSVKITATKWS